MAISAAIASFVGGAAVVAAVAVSTCFPPWLRGTLERLAGDALGRETRIAGAFSVSYSLTPVLVAEDVVIANAPWGTGPHMIRAARLKLSLDLESLWSRPVRVRELEIEGVRIRLETDADGRGNWQLRENRVPRPPAPAERSTGVPVVLDHAVLQDVELTFHGRPGTPALRTRIDRFEARLDPLDEMVDLSASGTWNDRPWDLAGQVGTLARLFEGRAIEHGLTAHIGGATVAVRGRIDDPLSLGGPDGQLELAGPDLAAALGAVGLRSPMGGPFRLRARLSPAAEGVDVDLTAELDGVSAAARGRVGALLRPDPIDATVEAAGPDASKVGAWTRVEGIPPQPFTISGRVRREGSRVALEGVRARVGGTSLEVGGVLGTPPRWVDTKLSVEATGLDLSQLSALTRLHLPAGRFAIRGRFLRRADALAVAGVELRTQDAIIRAGGTIGEPPRLASMDLDVEASGPDLSRFSGVAKVDLPGLPFAVRGRVARSGSAFDLDGIEGQLGEGAISVQGRLVPVSHLVGTALRARVAGPSLEPAAALVGLRDLPAEPYDVSGHVVFEADGYRLDGVEAQIGRMRAAVSGRLGRQPAVDGTELEGRVDGIALSDLAAWNVRTGLPGDTFTVAGRLRVEDRVYHVDHVAAEVGADRIVVNGTLGALPDLSAADVAVDAVGPSLADLGRFLAAAGVDPPERIPAEPYAVSGRARRLPGAWELTGTRATIGNVEIGLDGVLGSGERLRGTDVSFEVRAPDTSLPSAVVGRTLPDGPLDARGRLARGESGFRFEPLSIAIGDARVGLSGVLGEPPRLEGTALDVDVAGPDLAAVLGPLTGIAPLPSDPFHGSAHLEGNAEHFTSRRVAGRLGETDLEGTVVVHLEGRPFVEAELHSRRVIVRQLQDGFLGDAAAPAEPVPGRAPPGKGERLIPDAPLALSGLQAFDARFVLTAADLVAPGSNLRDVTVAGGIREGALSLDRIEATGRQGGRATASLSIEPRGDGYLLRVAGHLEDGRIDLSRLGEDPSLAPPVDLEFAVAGTGRSLRELAASSDGSALIHVGPGQLPTNLDDVLTSGILRSLLDSLNPFRKTSTFTALECGIASMSVENGKVTVAPIAVRTDRLAVTGSGRVDLDSERIALEWRIKPRRGVGLSATSIANPYIRLGGTLAAPSIELKPLDAVVSTSAAVASVGVTVLARGFYDRITAGQDVCLKALKKVRREAESRETRRDP